MRRDEAGRALTGDDGEPLPPLSPLFFRARCLRACRIHEARLVAGIAEDESIEAEAGAYMLAEDGHNVHNLARMVASYIEALNGK